MFTLGIHWEFIGNASGIHWEYIRNLLGAWEHLGNLLGALRNLLGAQEFIESPWEFIGSSGFYQEPLGNSRILSSSSKGWQKQWNLT